MKAYIAYEDYSGYSAVVFAETSSKARYTAYQISDEVFEGTYYSFIEFCRAVSIGRCKELDSYSKDGKAYMDWANDEDRIVLVKELGWYCQNETDIDCSACPAKDFCTRYQDEKEELEA